MRHGKSQEFERANHFLKLYADIFIKTTSITGTITQTIDKPNVFAEAVQNPPNRVGVKKNYTAI